MLKGGSLLYVLLVSLIISGLYGFFLLLYLYDTELQQIFCIQQRLNRNGSSALNFVLSKPYLAASDAESIEFMNQHLDSAMMHLSRWGCFHLIQINSKLNGYKKTFHYLASEFIDTDSLALVATDQSTDLTLSGTSGITGRSYVPHGRIHHAFIHDKNHIGKSLSEVNDVRVAESFFENYQIRLHSLLNSSSALSGWQWYMIPQKLERSFSDSTCIFYSKDPVFLNGVQLFGNIAVISEKSIFIGRQSKLSNVILKAPRIIIDNGVRSSFQAFAEKKFESGDSCNFFYPSLILAGGEADSVSVMMGKNNSFDGYVLTLGFAGNRKSEVQVQGEDIKFRGQMVVDGTCNLSGSVEGNIICRSFLIKDAYRTLKNYMTDLQLDGTAEYGHYSLFSPFNRNKRIQVLSIIK